MAEQSGGEGRVVDEKKARQMAEEEDIGRTMSRNLRRQAERLQQRAEEYKRGGESRGEAVREDYERRQHLLEADVNALMTELHDNLGRAKRGLPAKGTFRLLKIDQMPSMGISQAKAQQEYLDLVHGALGITDRQLARYRQTIQEQVDTSYNLDKRLPSDGLYLLPTDIDRIWLRVSADVNRKGERLEVALDEQMIDIHLEEGVDREFVKRHALPREE